MSQLALSASFEYLCDGSTAIINIVILSDYMTYEDDPLTEMPALMMVKYSDSKQTTYCAPGIFSTTFLFHYRAPPFPIGKAMVP